MLPEHDTGKNVWAKDTMSRIIKNCENISLDEHDPFNDSK